MKLAGSPATENSIRNGYTGSGPTLSKDGLHVRSSRTKTLQNATDDLRVVAMLPLWLNSRILSTRQNPGMLPEAPPIPLSPFASLDGLVE
jgi:hypothetical protein